MLITILKYILIVYSILAQLFGLLAIAVTISENLDNKNGWKFLKSGEFWKMTFLYLFFPFVIPVWFLYGHTKSYMVKHGVMKEYDERYVRMGFRLNLRNLTFEPDEKQVIYIENEHNNKINKCILKNLGDITAEYRKYGYEFVYLPSISYSNIIVRYYAPFIKRDTCSVPNISSDFLLKYMVHPENRNRIVPSLVAFSKMDGDEYEFEGVSLPDHGDILDDLLNGWFYILSRKNSRKPDNGIRFCENLDEEPHHIKRDEWEDVCKKSSGDTGGEFGDIEFSLSRRQNTISVTSPQVNRPVPSATEVSQDDANVDCHTSFSFVDTKGEKITRSESDQVPKDEYEPDVHALLENIQRNVSLLKAKGITLAAIHELIDKNEKVSRFLIKNDYRIFLPDYVNMEIVMGDLPKALFFTFLNHPEGIIIKHIGDYYKEIFNIYRQLKPNFNEESLRVSVTQLCNPVGNRINENIARIRAAFIKNFDEHLAQNYFVTGKKGETYSISLDRSLVEWEDE